MLSDYLKTLGLTEKETRIVLALAELGIQPASAVARRTGLDRVTAYKNLHKLADLGFVRIYFRDAVQCFGLESMEVIEGKLRDRSELAKGLLEKFPTAAQLLKSLGGQGGSVPELEMFEGASGLKSLFRDLLFELKIQQIKQLRVLTSNTYEERIDDPELPGILKSFFRDLQQHNLHIEYFEATGGMVPERLRNLGESKPIEEMLRAQGTTNVFVAGSAVYLASYRGSKIGLKLKHHDLSQIFHFLFDVLGKV